MHGWGSHAEIQHGTCHALQHAPARRRHCSLRPCPAGGRVVARVRRRQGHASQQLCQGERPPGSDCSGKAAWRLERSVLGCFSQHSAASATAVGQVSDGLRRVGRPRVHLRVPRLPIPMMAPKRPASASAEPSTPPLEQQQQHRVCSSCKLTLSKGSVTNCAQVPPLVARYSGSPDLAAAVDAAVRAQVRGACAA
jgi:hypothetical protein